MFEKLKVLAGLSCALFLARSTMAETPTLIESASDGKRLLQLDGKDIEDPGTHKRLLTIDGDNLLLDPAAPAILVVDGHDVRHTAAGVKLAVFDGDNLRHGNSVDGKVLMNYHHPDLCPDSKSDRVYTVDGQALTPQQLVGVLYLLKPELFKLTDAETVAQQKAMAEAGAEADKLAAQDQVAKPWMVLNGHGPVEKINAGTITFTPRKGGVYPVTFDYTKGGGPSFTGVAASTELSGDRYIWAAYGTPKTVGLCVYKIDGGKLSGRWHPWYDQGDPKNIGTEELEGPDTLDGDYKITAAKAPATGAAYTGTVTIKPLEVVGAADDEKPYSVTWTIGETKLQGIAIRTKNYLYVATGGTDTMIGKFKMENGNSTFQGDFFKLGSTEMGGLAATD